MPYRPGEHVDVDLVKRRSFTVTQEAIVKSACNWSLEVSYSTDPSPSEEAAITTW